MNASFAGPLCFTVHGNPVPKQSFRVTTSKKLTAAGKPMKAHGFSNPRAEAWENTVAWEAKQAMAGNPPLEGPVSVVVDFYVEDRRRKDCTNLYKCVEDACTTGGVWVDDSQVVDQHTRKHLVAKGQGRVIITVDVCCDKEGNV